MSVQNITYPASLPGPGPGDVAIAERRLLSNVAGFQQTRQIQKDYLATQDVNFVFTAAQAAIFYTWWRDTIKRGGFWFSATWPLPRGWVSAVRRFIDPPVWNYVPGGSWTVSAKTQVRGSSLAPSINYQYLLLESGYKLLQEDGSGLLSADSIVFVPVPVAPIVLPAPVPDDPIGYIEPETSPDVPTSDPGNAVDGTGGGGGSGEGTTVGGDPGAPGQGSGGVVGGGGAPAPNPIDPFTLDPVNE